MNRDYAYPLRVAAQKFADRTAFVYRDQRWTFRDADRAVDRLAVAFEQRGLTGERVVLLLRDEPTTVVTLFALARAGAVSVPVNPRLRVDEIVFIVEDAGASAIIADAAFADITQELHGRCSGTAFFSANDAAGDARIEDLMAEPGGAPNARVDSASPAMMIYTSGTTGFPKGVVRSHEANLWVSVDCALGQSRSPDDVEVYVLPLFGVAFLFQVLPMIIAGGTVVLDGGFDAARTWDLLERHRATRAFLAPTMLDSMLAVPGHEDRDVSSLRILNTAYEFPERVREQARQRFGDVLAYMYGMTEAGLCCSTPDEFRADPSNAGRAMGLMCIRVVDEARESVGTGVVGEIALEGPALMSGYHDRADATGEALVDGWLYTGDLGYVDDSGHVHMTGRKKAMIKTGGFSVDPVEVETALHAHPGVQEAAVVGVPDEHWGEIVVAFVSAADLQPAEPELLSFVRARLAGFKCPKRVIYVSELPKNAMGKIQRAQLRDLALVKAEA